MAAMQLKAHEDKTHRGANIASVCRCRGAAARTRTKIRSPVIISSGRAICIRWRRRLWLWATRRRQFARWIFCLKFSKNRTAVFRRILFLTASRFGVRLQLDEVAFPLILAYQLNRNDKKTYENHVKKAADFIVRTGPKTPQERWEEEGGYSPSTIAAEIAGFSLRGGNRPPQNGDEASATVYLATADDWARNVERWTATTTGKYGDGNYYRAHHAKRKSGQRRAHRTQQRRGIFRRKRDR
jgi:hypothetical protein